MNRGISVCLVPDGDLFEAISAGRVSVVTDQIESFTETGLALASGSELDADLIVTATGPEDGPVRGDLADDGREVRLPDALVYRGMLLTGVPNMAFAFGYVNQSWTLGSDLTCCQVCRMLSHMDEHGYTHFTPRRPDGVAASLPFAELSSGYIQRARWISSRGRRRIAVAAASRTTCVTGASRAASRWTTIRSCTRPPPGRDWRSPPERFCLDLGISPANYCWLYAQVWGLVTAAVCAARTPAWVAASCALSRSIARPLAFRSTERTTGSQKPLAERRALPRVLEVDPGGAAVERVERVGAVGDPPAAGADVLLDDVRRALRRDDLDVDRIGAAAHVVTFTRALDPTPRSGARVLPVAHEVVGEWLVVGHHVEEVEDLLAGERNFCGYVAAGFHVPDGTLTGVSVKSPREKLLDAAIEYTAENGLGDLSLRALAAALGTSHRMLIHHFGSKAGLWVAIVHEVERRQRELLGAMLPDPSESLPEDATWAWWKHISDPGLWPNERLFFELYGQALQGRAHTVELLDGIVDDWLDPITEINVAVGVPEPLARAHARLGIAVTRGLLLDLLATRDVEGVDAAMRAFIDVYAGWLERAAVGG